jgi:putative transposase
MDKLPLDIRSWDCPSCKTIGIDRDINAGKNILAAGQAVIVCGADVRPDNHSVKARRAVAGVPPVEATEQDGQLRNPRKGKKQKPKS